MSRYGYMLPDHHDAEDGPAPVEGDEVMCQACKQGPFTWLHTGVRWRLVGERGKLHVCAGPAASTDDFEVLAP